MLDLSVVRTQKEQVITALEKRGIDANTLVDNVIVADEKRRGLQSTLDQKLALANSLAKVIGELYKNGNPQQANHKKEESVALKAETKALQTQLAEAETALHELLCSIPNIPNPLVPDGQSEDDNEEVFLNRMKLYTDPLSEIQKFYIEKNLLKVISGEASIEEIVNEMDSFIQSKI